MKYALVHIMLSLALPFILAAKNLDITFSSGKEDTIQIIKDESYMSFKRSLDVRIKERYSEMELRELADNLKNIDKKKYDRTFIMFYLPNMQIDAGAWASAIYDPNLSIRILGATKEEYKSLTQNRKVNSDESVLGVWIDDSPYMGKRVELSKKSTEYFLRFTYKDGSEEVLPVRIKKTPSGKKISTEKGKKNGEFFIITPEGSLEYWDGEGCYYTADKQQ